MALNKDRIFKAADKYLRSNKIEKAIGEYETWLKENPKDWNTIRIVGDLYARISRNDEAIKKYAQVAEHYRRDGFNVRAIATYKMVLRLDPGNEAAMRNLAELQAEEGLNMEAKSYYQTLVELYTKQGHKRLASEVFKKLAEIDPQDLKIRYKYAEFLTKQGKPDEAAQEFVGIADQFIGQGKVEEAIRILEQGRSMAPTDPSLQVKLAQAFSLSGNHSQAVRFLEDVRASHPNDASVLGRLGEAYLAAGNTESAESAFQKLLELDPGDPANTARVAELRIAQGKLDTALEQLTPLVDRRVAEGDSQKAAQLLQKILGKDPYHVKTLVKLAEVHTILKQDSARVSAYDSLCEAYNRAGDFEKAVQVAEQLVELDPEGSQHKDRLKFFKSKLAAPPKPAEAHAPKPSPSAASSSPPAGLSLDQDLPELDLGEDDLSEAVSASFGDELSLDEPAPAAAPVPTVDLGDVVELTQEDEENIKEKLTEAEVFVRYGLVDKAIAQLIDVLESFRFHTESREKLIEIYKDQGMNSEAAEQLLALGQAYDKLGQPDEAQRARDEAAELNPALASQAASSSHAGHEELELTLESEADLSDAGIEIDVPPPEGMPPSDVADVASAMAPPVEEIPLAIEDDAFEEPEIDLAIDEPLASAEPPEEAEEVPLDVDLTGEEVDFLSGGSAPGSLEAEDEEISVSLDDSLPDVRGLAAEEPPADLGLGAVSADEDIEIDLGSSSDDVSFSVETDEAQSFETESSEPAASRSALDGLAEEEIPVETSGIDEQIDVSIASDVDVSVDLGDLGAEPSFGEATEPEEEFSVEIDGPASEEEIAVDLGGSPETFSALQDEEEPFSQSLGDFAEDEGPEIELSIPEPSAAADAPPAAPEESELPEEPAAARPAPAPAPAAAAPANPLATGLEEVDEYITLGLYEDARDTLRELLKQHPGDAGVLAKIEELGFSAEQIQREAGEAQRLVAPSAPPAAPTPRPASPSPSEAPEPSLEEELAGIESLVEPSGPEPVAASASSSSSEEDAFIDLASELSEEIFGTHSVLEDEAEPEGPLTDPGLDQIFREFRKGVEKQLGTEDYDTRYNLGIAYKEMGLLDEAIAEFQLAAKDEVRGLECCSMLGLCFMEKGMPEIAIKWFSKGLSIPGRREEEYHGLRYDLAQAYEVANQLERALSLYMEIYRDNAGFRDVKDRVRELQAARK